MMNTNNLFKRGILFRKNPDSLSGFPWMLPVASGAHCSPIYLFCCGTLLVTQKVVLGLNKHLKLVIVLLSSVRLIEFSGFQTERGDFVPQKTSGKVGRHFWLSQRPKMPLTSSA